MLYISKDYEKILDVRPEESCPRKLYCMGKAGHKTSRYLRHRDVKTSAKITNQSLHQGYKTRHFETR